MALILAVKNIPWAVTGDNTTLHSSGLVRNATNVFTNGRQGVSDDGLKVVASNTPNSNVIVKQGNAVIRNSKVDDERQSYIVALKGDTVVNVTNNQTSSTPKIDFIILEVIDPEHDTNITMTSGHNFISLRAVGFAELNALMVGKCPVLVLGQISWSGNATKITSEMITDTREHVDNNGVRVYTPSLQSGWRTFNNKTPQYYKTSDNMVHLRGVVTNNNNSSWTTIFNLPEGYRPSRDIDVYGYYTKNKSSKQVNPIAIKTTGEVLIEISNVEYTTLDGVSFLSVEKTTDQQ